MEKIEYRKGKVGKMKKGKKSIKGKNRKRDKIKYRKGKIRKREKIEYRKRKRKNSK
jgi:hypothetical protein